MKEKKCKGIGKAKDFEGCNTLQMFRKYGLGTVCGCFYKWFNNQPSKPIKKMSSKRQLENTQYLALRKIFLEENNVCFIEGCNKIATDIHHKYSGKDRNKYFLNIDTWLSVCRYCHNWIHDNSKEARKKGLLN